MLTLANATTAVNIAEIVTNNDLNLTPKPATLLAELCSSTNIESCCCTTLDDMPRHLVECSSGKEILQKGQKNYLMSSHDSFVDNYVDDLTTIFTNHISFARNVVNVQVNNFIERFIDAVNNVKVMQPEDQFQLTYFKPHELLESDFIESELSSYTTNVGTSEYLDTSKLTEDVLNVNEYLLIGEEEVDRLISSFISSIGVHVCLSYIRQDVKEYELTLPELLNYSTVNFLFYRNLVIREDLNFGLTALKLRSIAVTNRDKFSELLKFQLDLYRKDIKKEVVTLMHKNVKYSYLNKEAIPVLVYEKTFEKFSEENLPIEVLFGYLTTTTDSYVTLSTLLKNKELYLDSWNRNRAMYSLHVNKNKLEVLKMNAKLVFSIVLNEVHELEDIKNKESYLKCVCEEGCKYIDELELCDIENIEKIGLELIGRIRFGYSNAYDILKEMNNILCLNSKIEPKEAATLSAIKYLTRFMVEQVNITR